MEILYLLRDKVVKLVGVCLIRCLWVRSELRMDVPLVSPCGKPVGVVIILIVLLRKQFRPSNREAFPTPNRQKKQRTTNTRVPHCPSTSLVKLHMV
jgi:hypothetical protein